MAHVCITPLLEGFGTGAGLIIAIGAQNAFVLKQGILKNHVLVTVLICAVIDAFLIMLGVGGFGRLLTSSSLLLAIARWGGAAFLFYYGLRSFRSIFKTESLKINKGRGHMPTLKESITTVLALSLLNPHVYLDTVVLVGSIGAQFPSFERFYFTLGAIVASFVWFFSLGFGAQFLGPLFQKPIAWKILDFIIGCVMWLIALMLIFGMQDIMCTG
ncbi:MAG: LysE/ArgO family amino acid transporter [Alphaproteobacteria bacterium]|jgi:L-lysine exporter family protein LysE/ArgO|nr:LysE/ArgO family amino acid transporter [Alphaproteobacteria bacterium]